MKDMGNKRKSIGNKLRFEVFKRDSFTCKWCGKSSPDVVLNIDHIEPVSKGGTNEILNLVTSCFECNSGKSNRLLSDDTVVVKQKEQMDLVQEKRNQMNLMYEWKKGLSEVENESRDLVVDYIKSKCPDINISIQGLGYISQLIKKFDFSSILESVDISAEKYLRFDSKGDYLDESYDVFIDKIGGILVNKNKSPVQNKISYFIGIGRNKFVHFNKKVGYTLLTTYVNRLKTNGWSDEEVLGHLETEIQPKTKEFRNWTQWRQFFETQISQIEEQSKRDCELEKNYGEVTEELLDSILSRLILERENVILSICAIGQGFDDFDKNKLPTDLDRIILNYLTSLGEHYDIPVGDRPEDEPDYGYEFTEIFYWLYNDTEDRTKRALVGTVNDIFNRWMNPTIWELDSRYRVVGDHYLYIGQEYHRLVVMAEEPN